jgi:hypothetical protein
VVSIPADTPPQNTGVGRENTGVGSTIRATNARNTGVGSTV